MRIRAGYLHEEAREIAGGGFVGGVGNCADNREGDTVFLAHLGDGPPAEYANVPSLVTAGDSTMAG